MADAAELPFLVVRGNFVQVMVDILIEFVFVSLLKEIGVPQHLYFSIPDEFQGILK